MLWTAHGAKIDFFGIILIEEVQNESIREKI